MTDNNIIEEFRGGMGAVGGGEFSGSGSFGGMKGSGSRSPSSISTGGSRIYGSAGYSQVNPYTGASLEKPILKSRNGLGSYTGGSFGGMGKYVVGFPGIKGGSNLPASSKPSFYIKPKMTNPHPSFSNKSLLIPSDTLTYGKIEKHINQGIPGPIIANIYDNVNYNKETNILGPKRPYGLNWRDKNLTGYYGYQGWGYWFDPWYWGYGPLYPYTGEQMDYPDEPFNYEDLMQKYINADYMTNTIQEQLATQFLNQEKNNEKNNEKENEELTDKNIIEKFMTEENIKCNASYNKNYILIIMSVVLILYLLFNK